MIFEHPEKTSALLLSLYFYIYKVEKRQDVVHRVVPRYTLSGLNGWKQAEKILYYMLYTVLYCRVTNYGKY